MKNIEQYKAMFSQVHTDVTIRMEDYKVIKKSRSLKKVALLVVTLSLALAGFGTAYAMNLFGLRNVIIGKSEITVPTPLEDGTYDEVPITVDMVSLQGYKDSEEYKAAKEWMEFSDGYDQDGKLLAKVGNGSTGLDEKYLPYSVYTQEMADKLEEIIAKHGLVLLGTMQMFESKEELFQMAGTKDFLGEVNNPLGGYIYEIGTFQYDGYATLSSGKSFDYQFRNCQKGVFDGVFLNIGNAADYKEWEYKTASGVSVRIATSEDKSLIYANLTNSFVSINVFHDFYLGDGDVDNVELTESDLEEFAGSIDFSMIP